MRAIPVPVTLLLLALAVALALYPLLGPLLFPEGYEFYLQKLTFVMILAIFAVSLDVLVGVTGMVSLGHAAFFGLGGYTLALAAPEFEAASIWLVLPASLAVAALASLIMGVLVVRTGGAYMIMATLALSQMVYFVFHDTSFAGGSDGMYLFFKPAVAIGDMVLLDLERDETFYGLTLACLVGVYLALRMVMRAPFGHVIHGIRENEERVQALGYTLVAYKLVTFVLGGTIAGLAGFLAATQYGFVDPSLIAWLPILASLRAGSDDSSNKPT